MTTPKAREAIGLGRCQDCGGKVALKVSVNARVYYRCGNLVETRECGARHTYGPGKSAEIVGRATKTTPPKAPEAPTSNQSEGQDDAGISQRDRNDDGGWGFARFFAD